MRDEYGFVLIAWVVVIFWIGFVILTNRKVQPKALFYLFVVEMWERFSFYGMRAFLVLYLTSLTITGGFNNSKSDSYGIYAAYGALVYLTPLAGGFLADKFLGFRRSIIWGAILMASGQFVLSFSSGDEVVPQKKILPFMSIVGGLGLSPQTQSQPDPLLLYTGLSLLVIGNGFFKPNISSLIGKFYTQGDPRRDGAFTIFYMGINIGAFLAPITCGTVAELEGWHYGFLCAGGGMLLGLNVFLYTSSRGFLEYHAEPPSQSEDKRIVGIPIRPAIYVGTFLFVPLAAALIHWNFVMNFLLAIVGGGAILFMLYLSFQYPLEERQRMWVVVSLLFFVAVFWAFFELAGSALNIFTQYNVNKTILGQEFATSNFQSVNAFFIMLFAPVFSIMWVFLARRGLEPAAPVKFAFGLLLVGAGFLVLNIGKEEAVNAMVPAIYLILLYLFHTLGELSISPVGLSLVTKLAPAKIVGFMMGFWFLSSAIGLQAGASISKLTEVPETATPQESLEQAIKVFNEIGIFAIASGVLLLVLSPVLRKWMHGIR